jgi:hypothetical protein
MLKVALAIDPNPDIRNLITHGDALRECHTPIATWYVHSAHAQVGASQVCRAAPWSRTVSVQGLAGVLVLD